MCSIGFPGKSPNMSVKHKANKCRASPSSDARVRIGCLVVNKIAKRTDNFSSIRPVSGQKALENNTVGDGWR